jgi:hypothetical protein
VRLKYRLENRLENRRNCWKDEGIEDAKDAGKGDYREKFSMEESLKRNVPKAGKERRHILIVKSKEV